MKIKATEPTEYEKQEKGKKRTNKIYFAGIFNNFCHLEYKINGC